MCNRYQSGDLDDAVRHFNARPLRAFNAGPSTIHPKEPGLVVREQDGETVVDQMTWGFPLVLKGKKGQPLKPKPINNARFDKLGGFWKRWAVAPENRCLIPVIRYAEAEGPRGSKTETWLSVPDMPMMAWAGLWRSSEEWGDCYTGVMTNAAPELANVHDRAPVILAPDEWESWLTMPFDDLYRFDRPWPASSVKVEATDRSWSR